MSLITTSENNPEVNTNPPTIPYTWANVTTGEMFICIDNTVNANVWQGQNGTTIQPL